MVACLPSYLAAVLMIWSPETFKSYRRSTENGAIHALCRDAEITVGTWRICSGDGKQGWILSGRCREQNPCSCLGQESWSLELGTWGLGLGACSEGSWPLLPLVAWRRCEHPSFPSPLSSVASRTHHGQLRVLVLYALLRAMPKSKSKILGATDKLMPHITGSIFFDAQAKDLG